MQSQYARKVHGELGEPSSSFNFPLFSLCFPYGFPMVSPCFPDVFPMVSPWFPYGFPMFSLWFPHVFPMVSSCFPCGFSMFFLWFPHVFPMVSPCLLAILSDPQTCTEPRGKPFSPLMPRPTILRHHVKIQGNDGNIAGTSTINGRNLGINIGKYGIEQKSQLNL